MIRRAPIATAALCGVLLLATACSPNDPEATPTSSSGSKASKTASTAPVQPDSGPTPTTATYPDPTCETLIPESLIAEFTETNWTAKSEVFRIGGTEVPGGIQCTWADYDAPASDHLLVFGWAPISADAAKAGQEDLIKNGWLKEETDGAVFVTEDPAFAIAPDADGYGLTYEFRDGWVRFADTKQGLVLIEWPPA